MSTIKPRTATVDIYQGDYLDRLRHLEQRHRAALEAEKGATTLASEIPESQQVYDEYMAVKAEAEDTKIVVTVGALGRKGWRELVKEHPPREDNDSDEGMGVNEETFKDALVPISIVSPEFTEEDLDNLADVDFDRIYYTAFALNRSPAASPKVLAPPASQETPKNDES